MLPLNMTHVRPALPGPAVDNDIKILLIVQSINEIRIVDIGNLQACEDL
jgi:hypothetical protein